jgi:hypothetical protein
MGRRLSGWAVLWLGLMLLGTLLGCRSPEPYREFAEAGVRRATIDKRMGVDMRKEFALDPPTAAMYLGMAPIPPDKVDEAAAELSLKLQTMPRSEQDRCLRSFIDAYTRAYQ